MYLKLKSKHTHSEETQVLNSKEGPRVERRDLSGVQMFDDRSDDWKVNAGWRQRPCKHQL